MVEDLAGFIPDHNPALEMVDRYMDRYNDKKLNRQIYR